MKALLTYTLTKIGIPEDIPGGEFQTETDKALCWLLENKGIALKHVQVFDNEGRMTFDGHIKENGRSFAGRNLGGAIYMYNHYTGEETKTPMNPGPF